MPAAHLTTTLLALTALAAALDWVAVARSWHRVELVAKPLTLVLLVAAAGSADLGTAKPWVIAALGLGLAGDIALLFGKDGGTGPDRAFLLGLGLFLLGHGCYLIAFTRHGVHPVQLVAGVLVVVGIAGFTLPAVLRSAAAAEGGQLAAAVGTYAATLGAMTVLGIGTSSIAVAVGGVLFLVSDTTLAWQRFVRPLPRGPLAVIVTYHLAQALIVIGLIR